MKKGFSIIEILIVGAIIIMVISTMSVSLSSFRRNQGLTNAADLILTAIGEARSKTLSSEGSNQFGVHFASSTATVFTGTMYDVASTTNIIYRLPESTEVSAISLADGGADVIFKKITGKTDQFGSVTIRLISSTTTTRAININNSGIASM